GLPLGGGKGVIILRDGAPQGRARRDVLLDFGETVDAVRGAYITAEDVGTSSRDMTVIAEATTHVSGLAQSRGGSGDPSPYTALGVQVDVLAPCALGGVFNEDTVPRLQAPVIAGAANNQLADEAIADLLATRGILWAPDFVANAGGIINIAVELEPTGYHANVARRRVQEIGDTLRAIYDAAAAGITPLTAAMELARRRLAEPSA